MKCLGKWNEIYFILLSSYFILLPALFYNIISYFASLISFHIFASLISFLSQSLFHFFASLISFLCQSLFHFISCLELYHNYFISLPEFISFLAWDFRVRVRIFFFFFDKVHFIVSLELCHN